MKATAIDSLSDMIATTVVLIGTIVSAASGIIIDGYCGVLVGMFILYSGFVAAKDTISPLLGQPPEPELVQQINDIVYELVSYTSEPYEKKEGCYAVELDRTAFFPEGGGQYADTGIIRGVHVLDAQEKDGIIYHYTDDAMTQGEID